jgi:membrane fusion protein (multidrug efflux system)
MTAEDPLARPNAASQPARAGLVRRLWRNPWLRLGGVLAVILAAAAPFALDWADYRLNNSITDDAFVESHLVNLGPEQVSGQIVRFLVQEHDVVEAGQVLVEIDPRPYRDEQDVVKAKLAVAEAQRELEETALARLRAEVPHQIEMAGKALAAARAEQARDEEELRFTTDDVAKAIKEAGAALDAAQAAYVLAEEDYKRASTLFKEDVVSQKRSQEATKVYNAAKAEVKVAEARLARAQAGEKKVVVARHAAQAAAHLTDKADQALRLAETKNLEIRQAERLVEVRKTQVEETRRALAVAETNLGYTSLRAPFPGVIVHLYRHLGDHVPVGTPVLSLYNPELTYVTAHLEETKLEGVAPGNGVRIDIDAFSEPFRGRVVWINRATGANFALVPRNISAGEFTKVVQRVPVRILIEPDERWPRLRPGLSATVAISHGPGDPEWARQAADAMRALEARVAPTAE